MYGGLGMKVSIGGANPRTNRTTGGDTQSLGFSLILFSPTGELLSFAVFSLKSRMDGL